MARISPYGLWVTRASVLTATGFGAATPSTSARMESACWICSGEMMSAGRKRRVCSSVALMMSFRSKHSLTTSLAIGFSSTAPIINPRPLTSATGLNCLSPSWKSLPTTLTCSSRSVCSIVSTTARPAAAEMGEPPKVAPWSPGSRMFVALPATTHIPMGTPPPKPFARIRTSGLSPCCWKQNQLPLLPIPICTSSSMRRASCSRHRRSASLRNSVERG